MTRQNKAKTLTQIDRPVRFLDVKSDIVFKKNLWATPRINKKFPKWHFTII
ncbi:hypothetical protein QM565_19560 [Geitlerinema splendidum]|nr:hypothetical protein [Geitlerinema splendidum]